MFLLTFSPFEMGKLLASSSCFFTISLPFLSTFSSSSDSLSDELPDEAELSPEELDDESDSESEASLELEPSEAKSHNLGEKYALSGIW